MIAIAPPAPERPLFIRTHYAQLTALATAWLESGAAAVGICGDGNWLALWPETDMMTTAGLHTPFHMGQLRVELWVFGVEGREATTRLAADAALLTHLFALENELTDMTRELIDSQDQLLALFSLNEAMHGHVRLNVVLQALTRECRKLFNVGYAAGYLHGEPPQITHFPQAMLEESQLLHIFQQVVRTGKRHLFSEGPALGLPPNSLCVLIEPIPVRGQVQVALCLVKNGARFESPELKLLAAVCDQARTHFESVLLSQETVAQARMQTEMELAQNVQIHLLPQRLPSVRGLDIAAASLPALQVGGDFYDFTAQPGEPFIFAVGDVTGKGMPAAMLMAMTRTLLKSKTRSLQQPSPLDILGSVNDEMYDDFTEIGMFSTLFLGIYDHHENVLYFANAGHSPVIYCPAGGAAFILEADGSPVGVLPTCNCENQIMEFNPGDVLLVGTDGFNEAQNQHGEMFGYERLLALVETSAHESARVMLNRLYQAVATFSDGHVQHDDQTVVILKGIG